MPGISLVHGGDRDADALDAALESVRFDDRYDRRDDPGDRTHVSWTAYPEYPVRRATAADHVTYLEGYLYDLPDPSEYVSRVGRWLLAGDDRATDWLAARDGEFVLTAVDADGRTAVATDPHGRLPVYHATVDGAVVLSREPKFVREYGRETGAPFGLDRLALAQNFSFGHLLGRRTVLDGVRRLPPGAVAVLDGDLAVSRYHRFQFDGAAHADRSAGENASRLASLFVAACRRRGPDQFPAPLLLGLSGGLDSRTVAAGYARAGVDLTAATFSLGEGASDEERVAREVAGVVDADWTSHVVERTPAARSRLLETMQGMNHDYLAFLYDFCEQVRDAHGEVTYLTGDGGDKALPEMTPARSVDGVEDLTDAALAAAGRFPPEDAAALAGLDLAALRDSVRARFAGYPEQDPVGRWKHFQVRERGANWLHAGEDRNRHAFWSTTPFYDRAFFRYAMDCPDDQKAGNRLYRQFLRELEPRMLDVEYVDFGAPIDSLEFTLKHRAYQFLQRYPGLKDRVLDAVQGDDATGVPADVGDRLGPAVERGYVDGETADRVLADAATHSPSALYHLSTAGALAADAPAAEDA